MAVTLAFTMVPSVAMIQPTTSIAETATVAAEAPAGKIIYVTSGDETSQAGTGEEASPYQSLRYALNQANDGDTIILTKDIVYRSNNMPLFEINKNVTIDGRSHNLTIRGSHIILKKDAVLKNLSLNLLQDGSSQAKIYVNGHSLTFDGVSTKIGTNINQDDERPIVYGGDQDGNPEGPKAVIKIINGNHESRFKKIVAGSETGDSNVPVDILIDNKSAKVDEGIILGGETGSTTGEVNLSSNAKAAKKIDGTNALNNNVELKDFTSYAMELSGIQDLSLKDNAYLSSGAPINISGRVDVQTGSNLALTSPLPNSVGILSGGGKVYIGEEVNATINTVDGADKPTIEFAETLDKLNARNAISPIITTSAENFEKLNLKLRGVDEPLKMENGTYTQSQPEQDNQRKVQAVQELYTEANNLKTAYDDAKTQAGPAISPDDANNINNAKAAYEAKYQEATDALNQLEENLKTQINTYGLSSPVDTATVNDSDGNSQIDDIEVNLINELFQLAKDAKDSYDQAKDNLGATVDSQEAETINSKKSEYEAKYAEANVAFNNLSQMLQPRVDKQNLPTNLDEVIANDIDGNDLVDADEVIKVN